MSTVKLSLVEIEIMKVIGSDFRLWKSNHPFMGIDQYVGIDLQEVVSRLPVWAKLIIWVNSIFRVRK